MINKWLEKSLIWGQCLAQVLPWELLYSPSAGILRELRSIDMAFAEMLSRRFVAKKGTRMQSYTISYLHTAEGRCQGVRSTNASATEPGSGWAMVEAVEARDHFPTYDLYMLFLRVGVCALAHVIFACIHKHIYGWKSVVSRPMSLMLRNLVLKQFDSRTSTLCACCNLDQLFLPCKLA